MDEKETRRRLRKSRQLDDLRGTTLKIYRHMLREGKPLRITELQHELGLSSPSLVQYHIEKLSGMGLVREEVTGYVIEKIIIQNVFRIRRTLIPFNVGYVVFFSVTLMALVFLGLPLQLTSFGVLAIGVNVSALLVSISEAIRTARTLG